MTTCVHKIQLMCDGRSVVTQRWLNRRCVGCCRSGLTQPWPHNDSSQYDCAALLSYKQSNLCITRFQFSSPEWTEWSEVLMKQSGVVKADKESRVYRGIDQLLMYIYCKYVGYLWSSKISEKRKKARDDGVGVTNAMNDYNTKRHHINTSVVELGKNNAAQWNLPIEGTFITHESCLTYDKFRI